MKIGIIGIGTLGSLFGGALKLVNADVSLIFRNTEKKILFQQKGLKLNLNNKKKTVFPKVVLINEIKSKFDIILVFTKTTDTIQALNSIKHVLNKNTILMSLQNGLDNDLILENFVSQKNIIYGTTMVAADQISENYVSSFGNSLTQFKQKHKFSLSAAKQMCILFNKVGINSYLLENIDKSIWEKVAFNSAINSSCALLSCTPNFFNNRLYLKRFVLNIAQESCNIAISNGIKVNKDDIIKKINISCEEHGNHKPSMLRDIENKKITEIDSINGAIIKYGLKSGVKTTLNKALLRLIKAKELVY